jgi:ribosomal-protein-alanine N-acetyltransferase
MIPLITQTPRLTLIAASRALLTAELHKPHYLPVLLGAAMPADWSSAAYSPAALAYFLDQLTEGGRDAAGWYSWYALRKATGATPRTLVGLGSFLGPPDAAGSAEITFALASEWRGHGLATELIGGLVQQSADTGMVRQLLAHIAPDQLAAQQALLHNGFRPGPADAEGRLRFEREVEATS